MQEKVDEAIKKWVKYSPLDEAEKILKGNRSKLDELAKLLVKRKAWMIRNSKNS